MTETSYRLPDWLGGNAVTRTEEHAEDPWIWAYVLGDGLERQVCLPVDDLVEVRPPSIDDPTDLPLNIDGLDGGALALWTIGGRFAAEIRMTYLTTATSVKITADQARTMARALWQRANAVEAKS